MSGVLATKLYAPVARPRLVSRPRLLELLDRGSRSRLTLISASAGMGKSSLLADWIRRSGRTVAWLSLDASLSEPTTFLRYFLSSLQSVAPGVGAGLLDGLASQFPPTPEAVLMALVDELGTRDVVLVLVLEDYHLLEAPAIDQWMITLLAQMPPGFHLMLSTSEDPVFPLSKLRAAGELVEIRVADLRFTVEECEGFFRHTMDQALPTGLVEQLHGRTEGWAVGLQMAGLSLSGQKDPGSFVRSFTGSHRFVLDYLMEEVLRNQPREVQEFLLVTSVLERLCGPLCDSVAERTGSQALLEELELANVFLVPLDGERKWFRYHQLFAEMLRERLGQRRDLAAVHARAARWLADSGLGPDAFRHAAAADDLPLIEHLLRSDQIPAQDRGAVAGVLSFLDRLGPGTLEAHPWLGVRKGTLLLAAGQTSGVEEAFTAVEAVLVGTDHPDRKAMQGQMAAARSTVAVTQYQPLEIAAQAEQALLLLSDEHLSFRFVAQSTYGFSQLLLGDRSSAAKAYQKALVLGRKTGDRFSQSLALTNLGFVEELENNLGAAKEHFQGALEFLGEPPQPYAGEALLGLARVAYEENDLVTAERLGRQSLSLAHQYDPSIDRYLLSEQLLVRVSLAQGNPRAAAVRLEQAVSSAQSRGFDHRLIELGELQVAVLLAQGNIDAAEELTGRLPLVRGAIRVALHRESDAALEAVIRWRDEMRTRGWADDFLRALVLEARVLWERGNTTEALEALTRSFALAEPFGLVRLYLDEGPSLQQLLSLAVRGKSPHGAYASRLLEAFGPVTSTAGPQGELLSAREREVLQLVALGLSNEEIGQKLFLALDTVKGHNRKIFEKLQVSRRTEAVAQARKLGIL